MPVCTECCCVTCLQDDMRQAEVLVLPRLVALNSPWFDFSGCNFTEKNMRTKDKRDGLSKTGSGRVVVYEAATHCDLLAPWSTPGSEPGACLQEMGILRSYVIECNYNDGAVVNEIVAASGDDPRASPPRALGRRT